MKVFVCSFVYEPFISFFVYQPFDMEVFVSFFLSFLGLFVCLFVSFLGLFVSFFLFFVCLFINKVIVQVPSAADCEGSYHSSGPRLHTSMPILEVSFLSLKYPTKKYFWHTKHSQTHPCRSLRLFFLSPKMPLENLFVNL